MRFAGAIRRQFSNHAGPPLPFRDGFHLSVPIAVHGVGIRFHLLQQDARQGRIGRFGQVHGPTPQVTEPLHDRRRRLVSLFVQPHVQEFVRQHTSELQVR